MHQQSATKSWLELMADLLSRRQECDFSSHLVQRTRRQRPTASTHNAVNVGLSGLSGQVRYQANSTGTRPTRTLQVNDGTWPQPRKHCMSAPISMDKPRLVRGVYWQPWFFCSHWSPLFFSGLERQPDSAKGVESGPARKKRRPPRAAAATAAHIIVEDDEISSSPASESSWPPVSNPPKPYANRCIKVRVTGTKLSIGHSELLYARTLGT